MRTVAIATLGERLSTLRLCEAEAVTAVRRSLDQYGQLAAVTLFAERDGPQIIDGLTDAWPPPGFAASWLMRGPSPTRHKMTLVTEHRPRRSRPRRDRSAEGWPDLATPRR
jgi:hypothetical protein